MKNLSVSFVFLTAIYAAQPLYAAEQPKSYDNIADALTGGDIGLDVRYRYEFVEQDGFIENANASTLRTKFSYETGIFKDFRGGLEFENVADIASAGYNDTINGQIQFPVVADPTTTDLNQAYLKFSGFADTMVVGGRQKVNLDNQRFVGSLAFRQNDQTFDIVSVNNKSLPDTQVYYAYIFNVNRLFGEDSPMGDWGTDTHLINIAYSGLPFGKLVAYGYLVDLDAVAPQRLSSKTFGVRFSGKKTISDGLKATYAAEYARQTDHGDNPIDYGTDYFALEGGIAVEGLTAKVGYESLGSDNGVQGFTTPLATLHKFNGFADKFLATPTTGLNDFYALAKYKVKLNSQIFKNITFLVKYHSFSSAFGDVQYGTEWNALIASNIYKHFTLSVKYANYNADQFATDTEKFWLTLQAKF